MTEPISDEELIAVANGKRGYGGRWIQDEMFAALLARLDAAEAAAVPDGWKVVRVDGIPYLTPDRIRPLTEGEATT